MKLELFYDNNSPDDRLEKVQDALAGISIGATKVVFGWPVTRWTKDTYEAGTWGRSENIVGFETMSEAIASPTNWNWN